MKKLVLVFLGFITCVASASAQSFSFQKGSTAKQVVMGSESIHNDITNLTSAPIKVTWRIVESDFPAAWRTAEKAGLCDNKSCTPGIVLNQSYTSNDIPAGGSMDFHLAINLTDVSETGNYSFKANVADAVNPTDNQDVTFVITRFPTGVAAITKSEDGVAIYPNPARTELNVIYNESMDVKNIAVYNMIGKVVGIYKATDSKSARLNVENMPSGAYFVRLIDSKGRVAAIRKFTHM